MGIKRPNHSTSFRATFGLELKLAGPLTAEIREDCTLQTGIRAKRSKAEYQHQGRGGAFGRWL